VYSLLKTTPPNITVKISSLNDIFMKKNRRPLDHSLGFDSRRTQTSFESLSPFAKCNHFKLRRPLDFGLSVNRREVELLVSCNMIGGYRRPLDLRLGALHT
jgi:hypothetical protein